MARERKKINQELYELEKQPLFVMVRTTNDTLAGTESTRRTDETQVKTTVHSALSLQMTGT